jgi:hypothetical protein
MNRTLKARLARIEAVVLDDWEESMKYDAPLVPGSPEHLAALADPIKYRLAERPLFNPDEPGPEFPIL